MKNIIVPIDFSPASRNAAEYAVSLGKHFNADITFVHVIPRPVMVNDSILAFVMTTQAEIVETNKGLMVKEVRALSKKYPGKIKGLVKEGFAIDIIGEIAKAKRAELIVMGMKGIGRSNSVFGSTTTTIIQKLSFPVLVIPENADFKQIDHITFASDFDAETELIKYALLLEISEKFKSQIYILNVQKKDASLKADKVIGKMKASLAFSRHEHQFHSITDKNVEAGIRKFLESNPTDVLAMMAHKHSLLERVFGKVHTREMSYQTKIPLLVLQSQ